jgi:hypothetical protein
MDRIRWAFVWLLVLTVLTLLAWLNLIVAVPAREPLPVIPDHVLFAMAGEGE